MTTMVSVAPPPARMMSHQNNGGLLLLTLLQGGATGITCQGRVLQGIATTTVSVEECLQGSSGQARPAGSRHHTEVVSLLRS